MKVLCINGKFTCTEIKSRVKENEVYEVIGSFFKYYLYYVLAIHPDVGYLAEHFIPLSEIDERELVKERSERKEEIGV